ncbi:MAG TPA: hypothetical protein VEP90_22495, partial [Methylomirabilota bacterium]|nr:hypothetical protein [Methylomirabilota bacterium]
MAFRDIINPLRRAPKTTLSSGGMDVPPEAEYELGSTLAFPLREIVPDLANKVTEYRTYYQMGNYHSVSRASLRSVKSSIMGAEFFMEPAGDEDIDSEIAEFVWYNLTEALNNPWLINLARFTKFCDYGASIFETVFENRDWAPKRKGANHKTYTMLKKLSPRPIGSISRVEYDDNGGPVEILHNARRRDGKIDEVHIPIQKLVIFTNDEDNGDLLGKSMLRSAYPHWYYIQHLYKVDAIQKERHGTGVPKAKVPSGLKDKDKKAILTMLQNIRTNEHAGVLEPFGIEIEFMDMPGQLVDVLKSVEHHNAMIMLNVLAEFLVAGIGESGGGGRSTSASQQDIFMKANWAHANMICGSINTYLIQFLVGFNYDTDRFP